jgi:hypothetical protein
VALVAHDFTGDQKIDLVVANFDEGRIAIFEGQGTGEFRATREIVVGAGPYALLGADFNDDGIFDIAVANAPLGQVKVFVGDGTGTSPKLKRSLLGAGPAR